MIMLDLVHGVRNQISAGLNDQVNVLAGPYVVGTDTLTFRFSSDMIAPGMTLSAGLNVWQVMDIAPLSRQAIVIPSPDGSRDDPLPVGTVVRVMPRITDFTVFNHLNDQILEMSSSAHGLFGVIEWTQSVSSPWNTFPIDPSISDLLTDIAVVYQVLPGSQEARTWPTYQLMATEFGAAVRVLEEDSLEMGGTLTFVGKRSFTIAEDLTSDPVTWCGLAESMVDIPILGAAAKMLLGGEARRMQLLGQGDSRRPDEVPATASSGAARELMRHRDQRIDAEYARLMQAYPPMRWRW